MPDPVVPNLEEEGLERTNERRIMKIDLRVGENGYDVWLTIEQPGGGYSNIAKGHIEARQEPGGAPQVGVSLPLRFVVDEVPRDC